MTAPGGPRGHSVRLACGSVIVYPAAVPAPARAELVPCGTHGYCEVVDVLGRRSAPTRDRIRRPTRTVPELLAFLAEQPDVTVDVLMRQRFRLRLLHAAAQQGLVVIAEDGVVRATSGRSSNAG